MKRISGFLLIFVTLFLFFSCAGTIQQEVLVLDVAPVSPDLILDKDLLAESNNVIQGLTFRNEGVVDITTKTGSYKGFWSYDAGESLDVRIRPLVLNWTDETGEQGYIANLVSVDNEYIFLIGNFYLTDSFKQIQQVFQFSDSDNADIPNFRNLGQMTGNNYHGAVVMSHSAHRDGVTGSRDAQLVETRLAVENQLGMIIRIYQDRGFDFLRGNPSLAYELLPWLAVDRPVGSNSLLGYFFEELID